MRKTEADWDLTELYLNDDHFLKALRNVETEQDLERAETYAHIRNAQGEDGPLKEAMSVLPQLEFSPAQLSLPPEVQNVYKMMPFPRRVVLRLLEFSSKIQELEKRLPVVEIPMKTVMLPLLTKIGQHIGGDFYRAMDDGLDRVLMYEKPEGQRCMTVGGYNHPAYAILGFDESVEGGRRLVHELAHLIHLDISRKNQPFSAYRPTPFLAEVVAATIEHIYYMIIMMVLRDDVHGKGAEARGVFEYMKFIYRQFYQGLIMAKAQDEYNNVDTTWERLYSRHCRFDDIELMSMGKLEFALKNQNYPHEQANYTFAHIVGMHAGAAIWESHIPKTYARAFNRLLASGSSGSPHTQLLKLMCDIKSEKILAGPANLLEKLRARLSAVDMN